MKNAGPRWQIFLMFCLVYGVVVPAMAAETPAEKIILTPKPGSEPQDQRAQGRRRPTGASLHLSDTLHGPAADRIRRGRTDGRAVVLMPPAESSRGTPHESGANTHSR